MTKLNAILRQIVGRLKENMEALFMTMGGILIPLGFYLLVEHPSIDNYAYFAVVFGGACWLLSFWLVREKDIQSNYERRTDRLERKRILQNMESLLKELKELRQDLGGRNERNNPNK